MLANLLLDPGLEFRPDSHEFGFSLAAILASVVDMQTALVQHEAARVDLVHERDVVGGDDHGSARFVELDE